MYCIALHCVYCIAYCIALHCLIHPGPHYSSVLTYLFHFLHRVASYSEFNKVRSLTNSVYALYITSHCTNNIQVFGDHAWSTDMTA